MIFRNHFSVPTIPALARARRHLDAKAGREVTLVITGGLRVAEDFTRQANRVIKLAALDETQAFDEAGVLHGQAQLIEAFLNRHHCDKEDHAVPIILHHRLWG